MSALEILRVALVVEATVLLVALVLVVGHVVWRAAADPRRRRRVAQARQGFAEALADGARPSEVAGALRGLRAGETLAVIAAYAPTLAGAGRTALARTAADAGLTRTAERLARSRRWPRRLRAAQVLSAVGGGSPAMERLLEDRRPEVRAQAAGWAAGEHDPATARRLVGLLDDPALVSRFSVQDALLRQGRAALEPLAEALAVAEGPSAARLLTVCVASGDSRFGPDAVRLLTDPHPPTRALAAELAGRTTGAEAMGAIKALLEDEDDAVRAAAATALGVAHHWPSGGRLRTALRDPSWDVRRAAGLALEAMGPPGALLLRRALQDDDPGARDMARLVLGSAAGPG